MGELIDLASCRHRLMDPLITWQQNRPGLSDSLPAAQPKPAQSAFVNTFVGWERAALPRGLVARRSLGTKGLGRSPRCRLPGMLLGLLPFEGWA